MTPLSQLPYLQPGDRALLFDGECNLCHGLVRYLVRADRQRRILLATVQSVEGQAILQALGLPTDRFDSVVYVEQGRCWLRSAALFRALRQVGWPYRALALARFLPPRLADKIYDAVAGNRYRLFGRNDGSGLPGAICPGGGNLRPELYASLPSNRLKYQHSSSI